MIRRVYHPWHKWECFKAGFYDTQTSVENPLEHYAIFLRDSKRFEAALCRVIEEWPVSCEQFLLNESINRIAWLGQASMCIDTGIPSCFRGGFKLLTEQEQNIANATAFKWLGKWKRKYANTLVHGSSKDTQKTYQMRFHFD